MSTINSRFQTALTKVSSAGLALRQARFTKEGEEAFRAVALHNPKLAMNAIASYEQAGVSLRTASDALDIIAEESQEGFQRILDENLPPEVQAELLSARGDLYSSAFELCSPQMAIAAMLSDLQSYRIDHPGGLPYGVGVKVMLEAWLTKLAERPDFSELIELELANELSVKQWIICCCAEADVDFDLSMVGHTARSARLILEELIDRGRWTKSAKHAEVARRKFLRELTTRRRSRLAEHKADQERSVSDRGQKALMDILGL